MKTQNYQQLDLFTPRKTEKKINFPCHFTFVDLFAGIGGFRSPLEELGGECLGYSEIDKNALMVYETNFIKGKNKEEKYLGNIKNIDNLPFQLDLIVGGVPCQPWSIAGKSKGFDDPRGTLWFDVIRLVNSNKPKSFIFENVKGLVEPRNRDSLNYIINNLELAGYYVKFEVLNSYDFGLSQNRDRIFIVGIRKDLQDANNFVFPEPLKNNPQIYQFIEGLEKPNLTKKKFNPHVLFKGNIPVSRGRFKNDHELNDFFLFSDIRNGHTTIHSWDLIETTKREKYICETILKNRRKQKYGNKDGNPLSFIHLKELINDLQEEELLLLIEKKILRFIDKKGYEFVNSKISSGINGIAKIFLPHAKVIGTLTATGTRDFIATKSIECQPPEQYKQTFIEEIYLKKNFQPLTGKDYAKLQGFPDWFIIAEKENIAKKQLGNAVSIPVIYHLAKSLLLIIKPHISNNKFSIYNIYLDA